MSAGWVERYLAATPAYVHATHTQQQQNLYDQRNNTFNLNLRYEVQPWKCLYVLYLICCVSVCLFIHKIKSRGKEQ